ncbi:MAG: nucleotidyl transferase AbiEii/AbiGii toxin family protein [Deltaproteobacteria bacterium]|nr:nucleotidyl transferase AbiEii/AbiGii toxin family protein [Deltaproteobacteria bacterium]
MEWSAVMRVFAALEAQRVDYVVIGGVAMNLHGIARATEDIDIFIAPNAENVARLRGALRAIYDDETIEEITAADLCGEYPAVRYVPPAPGPPMDILTRLGDAVHFADVESERYDVEGQTVSVATPSALYEMKRGTIRPLDHADAARLAAAFDLDDDVKGGG